MYFSYRDLHELGNWSRLGFYSSTRCWKRRLVDQVLILSHAEYEKAKVFGRIISGGLFFDVEM